MSLVEVLILFILGTVGGSFVSALTYRLPRGMKFVRERSICPKCKREIKWYDNVPLFGFLILQGKCRYCKKNISIRYPVIEISTGLLFLLVGHAQVVCSRNGVASSLCEWNNILGIATLPVFLILIITLVTILVIDLENKIIPDSLVFLSFGVFSLILAVMSPTFYLHMLSGFAASSFLLLIHLFTKGKGMGLGDVKFALMAGVVLGWPNTLYWIYLSFIIGAVVGVLLIVNRRAKFGKPIPFGPFLVLSMVFVFLWGDVLTGWLIRI